MPNDLQIRENIPFQERVWRIQPVIWSFMLLFVVIGALGTFGGAGPLNRTTLEAAPLKIEFERFPIKTIPTSVTIEIAAEAVTNDEVKIWLDNQYLTRMILRHLYPEPAESESRDGGTLFTFSANAGEATTLSFVFEPHGSGRATTEYRVEGIGVATVSHLVYP